MNKPTVEQVEAIIYNPEIHYPHMTRDQAVKSAVNVTIMLIEEMNKKDGEK